MVALPTLVTSPVKFALVVTDPAVPVMLPLIGAVTVKPVKVPTLVIDGWADAVTVAALPVTFTFIDAGNDKVTDPVVAEAVI